MNTQKRKPQFTDIIDKEIDVPEFVSLKDLVEYANEYTYGERQEAQIFLYKFLEKEGIKSHIRAKEDENHCVKAVLEL